MFHRRCLLSCLLLIFFISNLSAVYAVNDKKTAPDAAYPQTAGKSVILMEASSGRVLYGKNVHEKLPPASVTKIMTGLLVIEHGNLGKRVKISTNSADTPESSIWLEAGETLTREQLLYGLMLNSANDAAVALSESIAGSEKSFVKLMNQRAQELGMKDSHFMNSHGLQASGHYTSAYDLALLSRKALSNMTFRRVVSSQTHIIPWPGKDYDRLLINHNRLLWNYQDAIGLKTGYTEEAGNCLVGAAQRDSMVLIAVTLNSSAMYQDIQQMLDYGFAHYQIKTVKDAGQLSVKVPVENGQIDSVEAHPETDLVMAVTDQEAARLTYKLYPQAKVKAPVKKNQILGKCKIFIAGNETGQINLRAADSVAVKPEPSFLYRFWPVFLAVIKFILKAAVVLFLCMYTIRVINLRRRRKRRSAYRRYRI